MTTIWTPLDFLILAGLVVLNGLVAYCIVREAKRRINSAETHQECQHD